MSFIESSLQETEYTQQFNSVNIPASTQFVTFRSDRGTLTLEEIQKMIYESLPKKELISLLRDKKFINTKIELKIIDIRWLLRDKKTFLDLVPILEQFRRDSLF